MCLCPEFFKKTISIFETLIIYNKKKLCMVRYSLLLAILCSMIGMQSCIHGELDDCPPMVNYAVAFEYTNHAWDNDRFYDDVKKINLFVFDEKNKKLVYTTDVEKLATQEPFPPNFTIPLNLPMGNYHILAWGNVLKDKDNKDNFLITPTPLEFVKGETTLDEARLTLQRKAGNLSNKDFEKLFFGELDTVSIPLYVSRVDTMPLMNDTKKVRVVIHWDHTGESRATEEIINYDDVHVRLEASNAEYNFRNNLTAGAGVKNVIYTPYDSCYNNSVLDTDARAFEDVVYYYPHEGDFKTTSNTCVYDFTILRMMTNSPISLVIERSKKAVPQPVNLLSEPINIIYDFAELYKTKGMIEPKDHQLHFNRFDNYRIDIYFTYDQIAGEYVTGSMNLLDWHDVYHPEPGGAD